MKKYVKQMTFLLLLAMLIAMVQPVCGYAAGDEPGEPSDYLLVISDRIMSQADVPDDLMPAGTQGQSLVAGSSNQSVKTGDYDMILPWILLGVSALGVMVYMWKRKQV